MHIFQILKQFKKKMIFTLTGKIKCMPIYWEKFNLIHWMFSLWKIILQTWIYPSVFNLFLYIWYEMQWYEQRHMPLPHSLYIITLYFTPYQTFLEHLCTFYLEYLRSLSLFRCMSAVETMMPWHEHFNKMTSQYSWTSKNLWFWDTCGKTKIMQDKILNMKMTNLFKYMIKTTINTCQNLYCTHLPSSTLTNIFPLVFGPRPLAKYWSLRLILNMKCIWTPGLHFHFL